MTTAISRRPLLRADLTADICHRALAARDARFDGIFFVGVTSTRVYCRPVCPARVVFPDRRRFFDSAAAAERAGFRPCLRCRPELAPGRATCDAVSRLASATARRIGAGALNGRSVADLARELGVSERHLRRALEREIGVSPIELAQTHRLLLAKRLLADTALPVTRVAFASGFQSLRRFNAVFRERYRMPPSAVRWASRAGAGRRGGRVDQRRSPVPGTDLLRLTLAYRAPLAWEVLLGLLGNEAMPGVEVVQGGRYGRTVSLDGHHGVVFVDDAAASAHLVLHVSPSLLPVLMPLLARLRHLFDLDAQPTVVDAHLAQGGLDALVRQRPGLRIPGALDGFEVAMRVLLRGSARRVVEALGEPLETAIPALTRLAPTAERVAEAGAAVLASRGVSRRRAQAIVAIARLVADRSLHLEPGSDVATTYRALLDVGGIGDRLATTIVMRALYWPDAFPASSPRVLLAQAERWRPWRAYAALHLGLQPRM